MLLHALFEIWLIAVILSLFGIKMNMIIAIIGLLLYFIAFAIYLKGDLIKYSKRKMNMLATEMFEELGYKRNEFNIANFKTEIWTKRIDDSSYYCVTFGLNMKKFNSTYTFKVGNKRMTTTANIDEKLFKAIIERTKELGW